MIIIKGYKAETTDLLEVEELLHRLQELILVQGRKLYTELFADEIETLCDEISFNVVPRPNIPVYDAARQVLDQRVSNATGRGLPLPYNFNVQTLVYTLKGAVYIRVVSNNEKLLAKLKKAPSGLIDFSARDDGNTHAEETVWNEIMEIYTGRQKPLVYQVFACEGVEPEWKRISEHFHSRAERADVRVRYQLTNSLLNMIGMGQQISPHKLMPYFDEALGYLDNPAIKADANRMKMQALQSVINITEELVMQDPNAPVPPTGA